MGCPRQISDSETTLTCIREDDHDGAHVTTADDPDDDRAFVWFDGVKVLLAITPREWRH